MKAATVPPFPYEKESLAKPSEEVVEKLFQDQLLILKSHKVSYAKTSNGVYCSCVLYSQTLGLGLSGYGFARNYPVNSKIPAASGFVVTYESSAGHMAHYTLSGQNLILQEANYTHYVKGDCPKTLGRILQVGSGLIKGYIN